MTQTEAKLILGFNENHDPSKEEINKYYSY